MTAIEWITQVAAAAALMTRAFAEGHDLSRSGREIYNDSTGELIATLPTDALAEATWDGALTGWNAGRQ